MSVSCTGGISIDIDATPTLDNVDLAYLNINSTPANALVQVRMRTHYGTELSTLFSESQEGSGTSCSEWATVGTTPIEKLTIPVSAEGSKWGGCYHSRMRVICVYDVRLEMAGYETIEVSDISPGEANSEMRLAFDLVPEGSSVPDDEFAAPSPNDDATD